MAELSNAMVALHRRYFGRGPGAAKAIVADDMVVCTLTDIYTPVERTLGGGEDLLQHADRVVALQVAARLGRAAAVETRVQAHGLTRELRYQRALGRDAGLIR